MIDNTRTVTATYGYDGDGNRVLEQYGAGSAAGATGYGNATAAYDLLNRLTWFDDTGSATRPLARIDNEYDAGGNVRRTKARHGNLDTNGAVLTGTTTDDHWYKYDAQNRFVTTKGVIKVGGSVLTGDAFDAARAGWAAGTGSGTIERGTRGVDLTYDAAGQRKTATQWAYLTATVRDPHPPGPITPENTPPDPATPVVTMEVGYQGTRTEIYGYDAAGYLTTVSFADQGYDDDDQGHAIANATTIDYVRGRYERDLMGRITAAREYAEGGAQIVQQRTNIAYEHGSSRVESDWVQRWQRANGGSTSYANQGITLSNYTYDGMDQLRLINGGNYAVGATPGIALPQTNHQTAYDYIYRESALQSQVTSKAKISDTSTHTSSTTSYDANGFVTQVVTTGQNARTMSYTTDVAGQVIRRSQLTGGSTNGPAVFSTYLSGLKLGEVSNDGTDNTDFATAVNAQATARGPGAFRNGATAGTPAADFDQSYASITPGSTTPVSGSYTVRAGDTLAAIAAGLWGDASLWYLLAEANGLSGPNASLSAGQALTVPNKVTNFHNTSSTFRPYDPNKALGDVQPGAPVPPKPQSNGVCGVIGQIITVVMVAIGTISGFVWGGPAGAALGAAVADAQAQGYNILLGNRKRFDFKEVALTAITAAVTTGLGPHGVTANGVFAGIKSTIVKKIVTSVAASAISQGIGVATGLQDRFDWGGVAVAGITAGAGHIAGGPIARLNLGATGTTIASNTVGAIAAAGARSLIDGTSFGDNLLASLPGVIGNTIGDIVAGGVQKAANDGRVKRILGGKGVTDAQRADPAFQDYVRSMVDAGASSKLIRGEIANGNADAQIARQQQAMLELAAARANGDIIVTAHRYGDGASRYGGASLISGVYRPDRDGVLSPTQVQFQYESESRARRGGNGGPPLEDPRTLKDAGLPPPTTPEGLILGLADNALDIFGPATELTSMLLDGKVASLRAELLKIDPRWRDPGSIRAPGPESLTSKRNSAIFLEKEAVRLSYGKFGSAEKLQIEALKVYQKAVDRGFAEALRQRSSGELKVYGSEPIERALGRVVDTVARNQIRDWFRANGIREGAGLRVQVNRRLYDGDSVKYRQPDLAIGRVLFDASLSPKSATYGQIRDFIAYGKPSAIILVRPTQLGNQGGSRLIYRGN